MSGHSKWSTIKRQKGAADAKRGNLFTKLANSIAIAVREGGSEDPNFNFKLRLAVEKAREANMPKDNIARAIEKGAGKGEGGTLQSAVYEGFGPSGIAVVVEAITDNTTRTGSELRNFFEKHGGNLGGPGSVSYMFSRMGEIDIARDSQSYDSVFDKAIEAEALDVEEGEDGYTVYTNVENLHKTKELLGNAGMPITGAELIYQPIKESVVKLEGEKKESVENFLTDLSDLDDVQNVYANI